MASEREIVDIDQIAQSYEPEFLPEAKWVEQAVVRLLNDPAGREELARRRKSSDNN